MTTQPSTTLQNVRNYTQTTANESEHNDSIVAMMNSFLCFTLPLCKAPRVYDIYCGAPLSSVISKIPSKEDSVWITSPSSSKEYRKRPFKSLSTLPLDWTNRQDQSIQLLLDFKLYGSFVTSEDGTMVVAKDHCLQFKLAAKKSCVQRIQLSLVDSHHKVHKLIEGKMPSRLDLQNAGSNFIELAGDLTKFHISSATRKKANGRDLHAFVIAIDTYEPNVRNRYSWTSNSFEISSRAK